MISISMHPLVQAVLRKMLPEEQRKTLANACVLRLLTAFPKGDDVAHWNECAALPACFSGNEPFGENGRRPGTSGKAAAYCRNISSQQRYLDEARLLTDRVVIRAKPFGADHPNFASALNNRGVFSKLWAISVC